MGGKRGNLVSNDATAKRVRLPVEEATGNGKFQEEDGRSTPQTRVQAISNVQPQQSIAFSHGVVTPAAKGAASAADYINGISAAYDAPLDARRELFPSEQDGFINRINNNNGAAKVTPVKVEKEQAESPAKRKLLFGRLDVKEINVQENVRQVYQIIRKRTGTIGGNGSHGPIYGELTMGSMQKMINLMKQHTGFDSTSKFIDVGSGIGKPNLHVLQDPGVDFSYGIEIEVDRWLLGLTSLKGLLDAAAAQTKQENVAPENRFGYRCLFEHGDIRNARTFDPFTHVYMFSIG